MTHSTSIHCVLTHLFLLVGLAPTICQGQYVFTSIDFPGAAETVVLGVNNKGEIVGQFGDIDFADPAKSGNRGFVFDGETFQTIHVPDSQSTSAWGINDDGVIVGGYRTTEGLTRGFRFDGSTYDDIVTPFADGATVSDINNRGHLVGTYTDDQFDLDAHGFYFDGVDFQSFDFPDSNKTRLTGINDSEELVGYFETAQSNGGFVLSGTRLTPITEPSTTQLWGVNNDGQVVGEFLAARSLEEVWYQSFIFDLNSLEFTDAVDLPGPDCTFSALEPAISRCIRMITGINSDGTIVGFYDNNDGAFHGFIGTLDVPPMLEAGDANQDLKFDQHDLVQVLVAGKYLTGQRSTWGEGDWDGAPGGSPGDPPLGDGVFDQRDIIAALGPGHYLSGDNAAVQPNRQQVDGQASRVDHASKGAVAVDDPAITEMTSMKIDSAASVFTGATAQNLDGGLHNDADNNIFRKTFGSSSGPMSFDSLAQTGLSENVLLGDLSVIASLQAGGPLGNVDWVHVPEPASVVLFFLGAFTLLNCPRRLPIPFLLR